MSTSVELQKRREAAEIIVRESARWGYELAAAGKPYLEPHLEWDADGNPIVKVRSSCATCGQPMDSPPCSRSQDGSISGHPVGDGVARKGGTA